MYLLELNASYENWKLYWLRRRHPRFQQLAQKIFQRDHFTCQFCDLHTQHAPLEVVNLDQNYHNNKPSNLATACPLCSQCFFLESIGTGSFGGGSVIYLPELTQNQLNALCHQLFQEIAKKSLHATAAESILRDFKFRTNEVDKIFGDNTSDPAKFGMLLLTANLDAEKRHRLVAPLRLLPLRSRFAQFTDVLAQDETVSTESSTFDASLG
jgi:intracellular multiplication protein IcmJ